MIAASKSAIALVSDGSCGRDPVDYHRYGIVSLRVNRAVFSSAPYELHVVLPGSVNVTTSAFNPLTSGGVGLGGGVMVIFLDAE